MKTYLILCICSFMALSALGQQLQWEKASPFTAVKWDDQEQPMVEFKGRWYGLKKLDAHTTEELLHFCQQTYGDRWQKRFSEDLVEVLTAMGTPPDSRVKLVLLDDEEEVEVMGTYTLENRQKVLEYNNRPKKRLTRITAAQALEDIQEFQQILQERSSYVQLSAYDYQKALDVLKKKVSGRKDSMAIHMLTHELAQIMAEIGDRHSSVKNEWLSKAEHPGYSLQLPFTLAPLDGKALALKQTDSSGKYSYWHPDFPYVQSINEVEVHELMDSLAYKPKKAPEAARFTRSLAELQRTGRLYFRNNLEVPEVVEVVFSNGKTEKVETLSLVEQRLDYFQEVEKQTAVLAREIEQGEFQRMTRILEGNIAYVALPRMYDFESVKGLKTHLDAAFETFRHTKALIIDLRFNPGGTRDLIQQFAAYIIPKAQSPWVANVAYLRTAHKRPVYTSMTHRYLYTYDSDHLDDAHRKAIDAFAKDFHTEKTFDTAAFSAAHYMVLESGGNPYQQPVYLLVNEHSFSAATVFTSAFKGLPNVKIAGITTDGSSGNSQIIHLKNSNIRVRVSTMLSFQRNGKTLDGNGTPPDIYLPVKEAQLLKGKDMQLNALLERIME